MPRRTSRTIAFLLLLTVGSLYANPLRPRFPALGFGDERVKTAPGNSSKETPRPAWMPRRHLPLVKLPTLDPVPLSGIIPEYTDQPAVRILPRSPGEEPRRADQCFRASRAPPVTLHQV